MARRFASQERILPDKGKVLRQPWANRFVHWGVAVSIFVLFFSGFGQMPLYKRYMLSDLPGMAWAADYAITLSLHYLAAALLVLVATFHLAYHGLRRDLGLLPRRGDLRESWLIVKAMLTRGKEPPSDKYLAEQRVAYAFIAANVAVLILTGFLKMAKNVPGGALPPDVLWAATTLHNLSTVLLLFGIVGHLVAFVVPANRKLVPAMFGGHVDLDYVAHRHCHWYDRLRGQCEEEGEGSAEPAATAQAVAQGAGRLEQPRLAGGEE